MPQQLRAGRISNDERLQILTKMGKIAQEKYNDYLLQGAGNYNLQMLRNSLMFFSDVKTFQNVYWIKAKTDELTKVAYYFEYGTGIFNSKSKRGAYIKPKKGEYMVWKSKTSNQMIFAKRTKGVRPVFMMTKAIHYVADNQKEIQRKIRLNYQGDNDD